jgi:flavin-dependent dehydrogenase
MADGAANSRYDVIIVGARVAGSSTARLLAREGHRVLVVDRATFPSDTVSTHAIDAIGMALLDQWGLTDKVFATNTPRVAQLGLTADGNHLVAPAPCDIACPRRTVLDKLLVDEARDAGAEIREGVTVKSLLRDGARVVGIAGVDADGTAFEAHAEIVVGADGMNSFVAREVDAVRYGERCGKGSGYYAYYSGTGLDLVELAFGTGTFAGVFPTNDDQVCIFGGRDSADFAEMRSDPDAALIDVLTEASERIGAATAAGTRETRFFKYNVQPGFFRVPYGDGWALVGDAGFHIDPVTGRGIGHAFRDAALLARAISGSLSGATRMHEALAAYNADRDRMSLEVFRITHDIADLEWSGEQVINLMFELLTVAQPFVDEVSSWAQPQEAAPA